jgi:phosphomannomutase
VIDVGMCTTPMYGFAVTSDPSIEGGLMITASHNPAAYNGIKLADHTGMPISGLAMLPIVQGPTPALAKVQGTVTSLSLLDSYLEACLRDFEVDLFRGLKIVVDYGNGMGALAFRPLCDRLGIELTELYPEPDANFPHHDANPAVLENLRDVCAAVVAKQADLGIALDGDADRIAFIDNEGVPIRGDQMLAFFAKDLLKREPGAKVVTAPNQSWATTDAIRQGGGEAIESRIGRTLAIMAIREQGAALGGEVSSHFFFRETDGLERSEYTFLRAVKIWRELGGSWADAVRDLRGYFNSWEVNIEVHDKTAALQALENQYAATATVINRLDGIRCEFDRDWWFIVRPSNNEPLIRITVEAKDETLMQVKRDEIVALLRDK